MKNGGHEVVEAGFYRGRLRMEEEAGGPDLGCEAVCRRWR